MRSRLLSTAAGFYVCAKRIIVGHCPHRLRRAQHCLPLGNLVLCKKRYSRGARNDVDRKQSNEVVSCDTNTKKEYPKGYSFFGAGDRDRTGTGIATHGILSPGRLPVPPHRHIRMTFVILRTKAILTHWQGFVNQFPADLSVQFWCNAWFFRRFLPESR